MPTPIHYGSDQISNFRRAYLLLQVPLIRTGPSWIQLATEETRKGVPSRSHWSGTYLDHVPTSPSVPEICDLFRAFLGRI